MAQIDLKHAVIELVDGFAGTFLVNDALGGDPGDANLTIDGYTGALAAGDQFTVAGETGAPVHTVLTHTETTGNTTSISFTPALASAAADNAVCTLRPHSIEVNIGDGNLEYTEKRAMDYKKNKGKLQYVREGDEEPMDVSLDFVWEFITAATGDAAPTIEDCFKRRGKAAGWATSGADPCEPYAVDLRVIYVPPCGGMEKETITLAEFRYEELQHSFKDAQVSVKGKCNVLEAVVERSA